MQLQLTPRRMLLGSAVAVLSGTWNLIHGNSGGAQTIVVGAAIGLVVLAAIFSTLRGKQPQGTGTLAKAHTSRHRLLDKILLCFVVAIAFFLILLALADVK